MGGWWLLESIRSSGKWAVTASMKGMYCWFYWSVCGDFFVYNTSSILKHLEWMILQPIRVWEEMSCGTLQQHQQNLK
jgi:hypothetical protein